MEIASSEALAKQRAKLLNEQLIAEEDLEIALHATGMSGDFDVESHLGDSTLSLKTKGQDIKDYLKSIDDRLLHKHGGDMLTSKLDESAISGVSSSGSSPRKVKINVVS
jgi:hypothetical protein